MLEKGRNGASMAGGCCLLLLAGAAMPDAVVAQSAEIIAVQVPEAPVVDGRGDDAVWNAAHEFVVRDAVADIDLRLKAVYKDDRLYFLVRFPDADESRLHKPWVRDPATGKYVLGAKREDCFVVKWSMSGNDADLRLSAGQPHRADIWFWKANRTDPAGYADDKFQVFSSETCRDCREIHTSQGQTLYLQRKGDFGKSAYQNHIPLGDEGGEVAQFTAREPSDSRADVRAKGQWADGVWSVEFSRQLDTGHEDDLQFDPARSYLFGVSRYEIAGRTPDPTLSEPFYGSGDVGQPLLLRFQQGPETR